MCASLFFFNDTATTEIYTLSLHDALPISLRSLTPQGVIQELYALLLAHTLLRTLMLRAARSEEHTSELQSHHDLVCRLLLEKKKKKERVTHRVQKCAQISTHTTISTRCHI